MIMQRMSRQLKCMFLNTMDLSVINHGSGYIIYSKHGSRWCGKDGIYIMPSDNSGISKKDDYDTAIVIDNATYIIISDYASSMRVYIIHDNMKMMFIEVKRDSIDKFRYELTHLQQWLMGINRNTDI